MSKNLLFFCSLLFTLLIFIVFDDMLDSNRFVDSTEVERFQVSLAN